MSRGPGHVEQAIAQAFSNPFAIYSIADLAMLAFPQLERKDIQHKHRVSVRRAANKLAIQRGFSLYSFMFGSEKTVYCGSLVNTADTKRLRRRIDRSRQTGQDLG
jgi:hypothetical protein